MEKTLSEEEKQNKCFIRKTSTKRRNQRKGNVVLSEKGKEISIKTEVASSLMKPFEE